MNKQGTDKRIIIIAGPNGAGKTTFAREYLPNEANCPVFINADLIAAGLSPFLPDVATVRAGQVMLEKIDGYAYAGQSFAFETTLSGRTYIKRIQRWRADGYSVKLVFLSLKSPEEAIRRVESRARQGGHSIPEEVIRRRFTSGLKNFRDIYCDCADEWCLYDNSGASPHCAETKNKKYTMKKSAEKKAPKLDEADDVMAALKRAARRAHLIAHLAGTKVVIMRGDEVVEIDPDPEMYEGLKVQAHEAGQCLARLGGCAPDIKPVPRRRFDWND